MHVCVGLDLAVSHIVWHMVQPNLLEQRTGNLCDAEIMCVAYRQVGKVCHLLIYQGIQIRPTDLLANKPLT